MVPNIHFIGGNVNNDQSYYLFLKTGIQVYEIVIVETIFLVWEEINYKIKIF